MSEDPQDEAMNSHSEEEEDDEDMEEDAELEKKLSELDGRLEASANQDYDAHVAKVDLLRQSGELDKLREARYARLAFKGSKVSCSCHAGGRTIHLINVFH